MCTWNILLLFKVSCWIKEIYIFIITWYITPMRKCHNSKLTIILLQYIFWGMTIVLPTEGAITCIWFGDFYVFWINDVLFSLLDFVLFILILIIFCCIKIFIAYGSRPKPVIRKTNRHEELKNIIFLLFYYEFWELKTI